MTAWVVGVNRLQGGVPVLTAPPRKGDRGSTGHRGIRRRTPPGRGRRSIRSRAPRTHLEVRGPSRPTVRWCRRSHGYRPTGSARANAGRPRGTVCRRGSRSEDATGAPRHFELGLAQHDSVRQQRVRHSTSFSSGCSFDRPRLRNANQQVIALTGNTSAVDTTASPAIASGGRYVGSGDAPGT